MPRPNGLGTIDQIMVKSPHFLRTAALVLAAVAGGVGAVYASLPTFCAVAAVFAAALWLLCRDGRPAGTGEGALPPPSEARGDLVGKLVPAYLLLWWLMLVAPLAAYSPLEVGGADTVSSTVSGSLKNQLLIGSFGMLGMLFLPAALRRVRETFWWLLALWGVYMLWGFASLFWSAYPAISFRNLVAFVLVTLGGFGLGAGFYGSRPDGARLFLKHIVAGGFLSALAVLIPLPLHWSEFDPLSPGQRVEISGNFTTFASRPTMVAALTLILAAVVGLRRWRRYDWLAVLFLLLPVLALKTRGPMLWAVLALAVVYLISRSGVRQRVLQAGMLAVGALGYAVARHDAVLAPLVPYLTRDNTELSMSLTGRVPLWDALAPAVAESPLTGAGFAAFWNPENLYLMERLVGFPVVSAHNGYLEEVLNTGVIGLSLFLAFWVSAMLVALRRARSGDALGWMTLLFAVFYLLSNLTTSLMQEYMEVPFLLVFVSLGLMAVSPVAEGRRGTLGTNSASRASGKTPSLRGFRGGQEA